MMALRCSYGFPLLELVHERSFLFTMAAQAFDPRSRSSMVFLASTCCTSAFLHEMLVSYTFSYHFHKHLIYPPIIHFPKSITILLPYQVINTYAFHIHTYTFTSHKGTMHTHKSKNMQRCHQNNLIYIYLSKEWIHQWVLLEHYTCQRMLMIHVMLVHQIQSWDTYAKNGLAMALSLIARRCRRWRHWSWRWRLCSRRCPSIL